jgi:site-specific recombinase XerD
MTGLLYGGGLRLMEYVTLRILDVDFDYNQLLIRNAKGFKDRIVPLPERFKEALIYTHVLNTPGISVRSPADMI